MGITIGVDFGTDSVRIQAVDTNNGEVLANGSAPYERWGKGMYCQPEKSRFRQHPMDHIQSFERAMFQTIAMMCKEDLESVKGISVASTGSSPIAVDEMGIALSMTEEFSENPNAMFFLWKDHSAIEEADEVNRLCHDRCSVDYTKYVGGEYSSEWYWAKLLYVLREDSMVKDKIFSWVEHCDWFTALLTGNTDPLQLKRSRCAAGHKAMWHEEWGGFPPLDFFVRLDPILGGIRKRLGSVTYTSEQVSGTLSKQWADKFGFPPNTIIGVGSLDAHIGAIGGEITEGWLVKVMGTSTCDMLIAPKETIGGPIKGICGQVDGSILPGMIGLEAGQAAFGDVYAWFGKMLIWPLNQILENDESIDVEIKQNIQKKVTQTILQTLTFAAEGMMGDVSGPVALDWFNGRRTPYSNQTVKGGIYGLDIGTTAPAIFKSLVEATAFGSKDIIEHFKGQGVQVHGIIGIGGVAYKSNFVMQVLADVLDQPIKVIKSEQPVALGAAMAAAVSAKIHHSFGQAQKRMGAGFDKEFIPNPINTQKYKRLYEGYKSFGGFVEEGALSREY
ncbi:ribulokinase [Flagellimonas olearia]|nr:ribulokinase [Allomuricauda olearia]